MILYLIIHLGCAFLSYGLMLAYFQRQYPLVAKKAWRVDMISMGAMSLFGGPIALVVGHIFLFFVFSSRPGYKHGFMLWPRS